MKYVIAVDCEGPACVVGAPGGTLNDAPAQYEFARRQATAEASAAARGLFAAGATQVVVWDTHGGGVNLVYDELDERCDIFNGVHGPRLAMLDATYAGLLFVGYHARDNTVAAPLAHTFSSATYQWIKLNGREVGEIAIDAAVAGAHGVPVLFMASDDKAVAEANEFFPGITTVTTKVGYSWNAALSKHPRRVLAEIEAAAQAAARNPGGVKPFAFTAPLELEIRHKRIDTADEACLPRHGWQRVDAYTVKRTLRSVTDWF
ncbi:MAG: DppA1 [Verrucomicrobiota bacterium]|jgi:D-amino peptidase